MSGRERGKVGEAHLGSGCGGGGGEQGELSLFLKQKKNIYKGGERGGVEGEEGGSTGGENCGTRVWSGWITCTPCSQVWK